MHRTVTRTSFLYVDCDVPDGETLTEWRRAGHGPGRDAWTDAPGSGWPDAHRPVVRVERAHLMRASE